MTIPSGTLYEKGGYAPYSDITCWPLPFKEISNNPKFLGKDGTSFPDVRSHRPAHHPALQAFNTKAK